MQHSVVFSNVLKNADDTAFYKGFSDRNSSIAPAISYTQQSWAEADHMILNADKTITMNVRFNHRTVFDENVVLSDDTQLKPSNNFWASSSMRDYLLVNMLTILFLAAIHVYIY